MSWDQIWKGTCAVVGTAATWFWGGWDNALIFLVVIMTLDWLSGVAAAFKEKKVDSKVGTWGLAVKAGILILVGFGNVLDLIVFSDTPVARSVITYWYIGNEGISLTENFGRLGVPIPPWLRNALVQLKNRGEKDNVQVQ